MAWRFVSAAATYPEFSISISPAIERAVAQGLAPPTAYLNRFDGDGITVGVNEDPNQVLDLDYCAARGIDVRRRVNGGGAIFAGEGSAFLVLVLPTDLPRVPATARAAFPQVLGACAEALRERFGIAAAYRPLNDVEVEGRKLMPTSVKIEDGVMTFRLLLNVTPIDTEVAANAVPLPPEKVKDKARKGFQARFTCLEREVGREIADNELAAWSRDVVRLAFGEDVVLEAGTLSDGERAEADRFRAELASEAWLYGKSEAARFDPLRRPGDAIGRGRAKAVGGMIWAGLLVQDGRIVRAILNGDWHPRPIQSVAWLEDALAGVAAEEEAVRAVVTRFLARDDVEFAGVEADDLMAALGKALADARG